MTKQENHFNDDNLFIVLEKNDLNEIKRFLEPFGIDSYDRDGRTMLINLIIEKKTELLKEFIKLNPNINHQDFNGYSALHFAIQEKFILAIDLLLDRDDLEIDLKDDWGNTSLLRLVEEEKKDNIGLIKKLIEKGASLDVQNNYGITPRLSMKEITAEGIVDYSQFL